MSRICLIVDNPLRDLDGLCLIAWHLACDGAEVFFVPMHLQGYDIPSLKPDAILANYVRENNKGLLKMYRQQGSRVLILDTEGTGDWWSGHVNTLKAQNAKNFVCQYLCWGELQAQKLIEAGTLMAEQVKVTGCPRYDFISYPWREALPSTGLKSDYVLINTNFPVVNPQFAHSTKAEINGWVKTGWGSQARAEAFARASQDLFEDVKKIIVTLANEMPTQNFVLRPHPFERLEPYEAITASLPNLFVCKEGTSLQWINQATALLHINCQTSIEAALMGVEALGLEWINHDEVRQQSSEPFRVSRNARSFEELAQWLRSLTIDSKSLPNLPERDEALAELVDKNYFAIDGRSARRVADALLELAGETDKSSIASKSYLGARQYFAKLVRQSLGYRGSSLIKKLILSNKLFFEREQKIPSCEDVVKVIDRIHLASGNKFSLEVRNTATSDYSNPYQSSFRSILVKCI